MKKYKNLWRITTLSCLLMLFNACGDTNIEETPPINTPEANTNSNSDNFESKLLDCNLPAGETLTLTNRNDHIDYIVDCKYSVQGDLNIEKNVTIQFQTGAGFYVNKKGSLNAVGTEDAPILFTGVDKTEGSWRGVFFSSNHVNNELSHTIIEYAGGEAFNSNGDKGSIIIYAGARLKANNNILRHGEMYGINSRYGDADVILENNIISSHKAPMYMLGNYVDKVVGGTYTGNDTDAILITSSRIGENSRWRDLGVPYHILKRVEVISGGGNMVIDPGVTIAFAADARLYINQGGGSGSKPSLTAIGTGVDLESNSESIAKPIIFTGINKIQGAWRGIYFNSPNPLNRIAFARIEYASNPAQKGAIEVWGGTVLSVHDVEFKEIQNCAIHGGYKGYLDNVSTSNLTYTNTGGGLCEE